MFKKYKAVQLCSIFKKQRHTVAVDLVMIRWSKQTDRAIIPSSNSGSFIVCARAKDAESYRY